MVLFNFIFDTELSLDIAEEFDKNKINFFLNTFSYFHSNSENV